ncbi:hypothetical protein FXO38_32698 [Capsicum annuum]|nr:hypothetical protein FXO38_32698 [Capsicum annuum]
MAPKSNRYLINEETSESSSDLVEYPMKKKAQPRETLPRGMETPAKVVTAPKKTIKIKKPSTSPPQSVLSSEDDEDDKNVESGDDVPVDDFSTRKVQSCTSAEFYAAYKVGTSTAPPLVQSAPPRPAFSRSASAGLMVISYAIWNAVVKRFTTLETKFWLFIPTPIIIEVEPEVEVENIWKVPMGEEEGGCYEVLHAFGVVSCFGVLPVEAWIILVLWFLNDSPYVRMVVSWREW